MKVTLDIETKLSYDFSFDRLWGYPVRYHDLNSLFKISKPRIIRNSFKLFGSQDRSK